MILSHAHQDHTGLAGYVHESIPKYATRGTWALHDSLAVFLPQLVSIQNRRTIRVGKPVRIGPFTITAHLVDHSAPSAVALEVEADGHRLLYSGDIRSHGREGGLWNKLVDELAGKVDTLLMEGTTVGRPQGPRRTEAHLELEFVELMRSQRHMAVVFCSSHNLDRIVTIYRAAKRPISKAIPQWNRDEIRVVSWDYHQDRLRRAGRPDFLEQTRPK